MGGQRVAAWQPADLPEPIEFDEMDKRHIVEPDWIVPIPEPFVVQAEAPDWWGNLESESGMTEDRWIKAVETKPSADSFPVVHHAVTFLQDDPESDELGSFLNEYALGKNGDVFPDGTSRKIKAGANIRFNMHYHSIGRAITDRTSDGLTFYPRDTEPTREIRSLHIGDILATYVVRGVADDTVLRATADITVVVEE